MFHPGSRRGGLNGYPSRHGKKPADGEGDGREGAREGGRYREGGFEGGRVRGRERVRQKGKINKGERGSSERRKGGKGGGKALTMQNLLWR